MAGVAPQAGSGPTTVVVPPPADNPDPDDPEPQDPEPNDPEPDDPEPNESPGDQGNVVDDTIDQVDGALDDVDESVGTICDLTPQACALVR